jgi:hypothetical protein
MTHASDPFLHWLDALEARHLAHLNFSEVRRAVQALSSLYVERREKLGSETVFGGAGKRAAFAFFFAPLHFLLVRQIVSALDADRFQIKRIVDLGCGTGIAGAAWSLALDSKPELIGIERHPWAAREARWTYETLRVSGSVRTEDLRRFAIPSGSAIVAAFTINELSSDTRDRLLGELLAGGRTGDPALIVEPVARRLGTWWDAWARQIKAAGGREDNWKFRTTLPERLALMDRAAGLRHQELKGRSLWLPPGHAKIASR